MKKADNSTYRDQYHFTDDYRDTAKENPSIDAQPSINTTIKENPYRSNVEIEGGELVLQPDLSALFKAQGKKHSQGGMDVLLRPESFIFSDFKDLAITEKDKELFELKMGGSTSPYKNTPAEVVKQNVNVKHYNTLINNISDPYKDDLARKSSAMMLEKYIQTLGNIAYLQEQKKDFPDGLPAFSMGSAPVYEEDKKNSIDESKQYAKYGGMVFSEGGSVDEERCPCGGKWPNCTPCTPQQLQDFLKIAPKGTVKDATGMIKIGAVDRTDLYHTGTDPIAGKAPGKGHPNFNRAFAEARRQGLKTFTWNGKLFNTNVYKPGTTSGKPGTDKFVAVENPDTSTFTPCPCGVNFATGECYPCPPEAKKKDVADPNPNTVTGDTQYSKRADWEFTPWQKISQLYNWGQYANVRRYMPYRSRYNATYADPSLLNPEQTVGDIKGQVSQQLYGLNSLNPIMRSAQAAAVYGTAMSAIPGIRSQYDNQNAQIQNQFRMYNNQIRNNETLVNMQNDQMYYQQAVEGRKNFDNMRQYTANNAMNNVLRDVETNQRLAYGLLTQDNPAYGYDWDSGDFTRNYKHIKDVQNTSQGDYISSLLQKIDFEALPDADKIRFIRELNRNKALLNWLPQSYGQTPPSYMGKKGGKVKNPYK